jgi:hypothetical protein
MLRPTLILCLWLGGSELTLLAQANSWTKPTSGYWEEPYWSLGILPGTNQDIYLTNAGWKALAIGPSTAQNYPQTLNVGSVNVSAPAYSFNLFLLNYPGLQTPVVIGSANHPGSLLVASNSAVLMLYSTLQIYEFYGEFGAELGAFSIGGTFTQGEFSQVHATFLHVGDIGPGVYNFTNDMISVGTESVGSNFPASFNQFGGTNLSNLQLLEGGAYNMYDGSFGTNIIFRDFASFNQFGGMVSGNLDFIEGNYLLAGGILLGSALNVPQPPSFPDSETFGTFIQTGGTNLCGPVNLNFATEPEAASGDYYLSNGALFASGPLSVGGTCSFTQTGGVQTNTGISLSGGPGHQQILPAFFRFEGGVISTLSLNISSSVFNQTGGTNQVAGDITCSGAYYDDEYYSLGAGFLSESNVTILPGPAGGAFTQSNGVHVVSGLLSLMSGVLPNVHYTLTGGALSARNIQLATGASFHHDGGTVTNTGTLTLAPGTWYEQTGGQQFGQLQLEQFTFTSSNSAIWFPTGPCALHFANSSSLAWSNSASLVIEGWNGSLQGGGRHQLIFGSDATGLTLQQVGQLQFHNPMGISGFYPAAILASGEIVPTQFLAEQNVRGNLMLSWAGNMILQSSTNISGPYYDIIGASRPFTVPLTQPQMFFRLHSP